MTQDSAKLLKVTDSSCTAEHPERIHDVFVRGELKRTIFKFGEELLLPFEHGIKFMLDGFKVEEADGRTLNLPAVTKDSVRAELDEDQVIANLSELTLASLKLRAGQKKGGEIFLDATDDARSDLISFIIGKPPVGVADETVDGEDDLIEHDDEEGDNLPEVKPPVVGGKDPNDDVSQHTATEIPAVETDVKLGNDSTVAATATEAAAPESVQTTTVEYKAAE